MFGSQGCQQDPCPVNPAYTVLLQLTLLEDVLDGAVPLLDLTVRGDIAASNHHGFHRTDSRPMTGPMRPYCATASAHRAGRGER